METALPPRKSDLGARTLSAIVMLAIAGVSLWVGGWLWIAFVVLVAAGVWFEWSVLVMLAHPPGPGRTLWRVAGLVYCGVAAFVLLMLREGVPGLAIVLTLVGAVVGTDVGAYFAGRTFGGPKIAPRISPSKTWSGLAGGVLGATLAILAVLSAFAGHLPAAMASVRDGEVFLTLEALGNIWIVFVCGLVVAVTAQAGDFFESWMKRRAGVKDSGKLLPGHGGLFDRVDGLLAVCFLLGIVFAVSVVSILITGEPSIPASS